MLDIIKKKIASVEIKDINNKLTDVSKYISNSIEEKIRLAILDKAYQEVVKESTTMGVDINAISPDDLEHLIADKEKEIKQTYKDKVKNIGLASALLYLGIEISGI